jgi:eukaryotic-like serine/threonine-protein kinase
MWRGLVPMAPSAANASSSADAAIERGQNIDRFVVIGLVGRGGMGEVYAAYDPDLDRKVAIKLLRSRGDKTEGRTRLLREAQAIAKLQHPNVVVVYEVGTFGDSVFIAMEFVDGRTLNGWLHASPRSRKEVVQVFVAAGRGLAAAHAAGLVHRDFKPDNVMVTNDGQVRVMDFGLARQATPRDGFASAGEALAAPDVLAKIAVETLDPDATAKLGADAEAARAAVSGGYLAAKLTLTGAMLGTPAYMAPEQFAAQPTNELTDQFSFCVALYEFLYGHRPFEGDSFLALMTAVSTGAVRAAPTKTGVPGWMRKVVLRGLETDPARRFPSMKMLLEALETDPTVRTKRLAAGVGVIACLALAAFAERRIAGTQHALCRGGGERWAGVWEAAGAPSARKTAIRAAFLATGKSYAEQAFTSASRMIDEYVGRWIAMYADTCEATHVRGEQSTEVLDLRMSCLNERMGSVRALADVFAHATGDVVENAVSAAGALPRIDRCGEVALLKAVVKPPEDEPTRKKVEALREEKVRLVALRDLGKCADAIKLADELIPKAKELGYLPLVAETLDAATFPTGNVCIPPALAIERYQEVYAVAVTAHDDELAARAATLESNFNTLLVVEDYKSGKTWLDIARATIARIGGQPLLEAWARSTEANLSAHDGDWNAALAANQLSRLGKERVLGRDHMDVILSDLNIAQVLEAAGHLDEAADANATARESLVRLLGPEHPLVAAAWYNEGEVLLLLRQFPEARNALEHALAVWKKPGSDRSLVAFAETALGSALLGEGHPTDAIAPLEDALVIRVGASSSHDVLGETRFALARALWARPSERTRARSLARAALADSAQSKVGAIQVKRIATWLKAPSASSPPS